MPEHLAVPDPNRLPTLFLSHGAPPLVDDALWVSQLKAWAGELATPSAILIVSAHWEAAPLTIGSTDARTPLTYDFWGFPAHYSEVTYAAPGAPDSPRTSRRSCPTPNRCTTTQIAGSTTVPMYR